MFNTGTRHRKPAQDLLTMLRSCGTPELVCQSRAADVDCLIDTAAASVGEDKVRAAVVKSQAGAFYACEVGMLTKLSLPRTNQFEQPPTFDGVIKLIYECFQDGFWIRSSVREADVGVYRSLAPMHGSKVRAGLFEQILLKKTPHSYPHLTGDYGIQIVNYAVSGLKKTGVGVHGIGLPNAKAQLRDPKAMEKAKKC